MWGPERITGTLHLALDPGDPHNQDIVDIEFAPVDSSGRVVASADLVILAPLDPARG